MFKDILLRVIFDGLSLFLVYLPWIILQTVAQPYRRGFFCNDESISYPYKDNTITNAVCTGVGFAVAIFTIFVTECCHYLSEKRSLMGLKSYKLTNTIFIPNVLVQFYKTFGIFLFGLAVQQTMTNIGKYSLGRLRPHFLSVCNPDFTSFNCTMAGATGSDAIYLYIDSFTCNQSNSARLKDSRMSFPSGHTSFSSYIAVFLILYLQARFTWKGSKLLKHFIQAILIYVAFFVGLSRVSDYKHHWGDVLAGAFLGIFIACLTAIHISSQFKYICMERYLRNSPQMNSENSQSTAVIINNGTEIYQGN